MGPFRRETQLRWALYLDTVQWCKYEELPPKKERPKIPDAQEKIKDEPFHIKELNLVIGKLKNKKTPGPDDIAAELLKWTSTQVREKLLEHINEILTTDKWDHGLDLANVVSIYKKATRPISQTIDPYLSCRSFTR